MSLRQRGQQAPRPAIETPQAAQARADIAARFLEQVLAACPGLPLDQVSEEERQVQGGQLFAGCGHFVDATARDLLGAPEVFGDLQGRANFLAARQREADAWRRLRGALGRLIAVAHDNYLLAQVDAVDGAQQVIAEIEEDYKKAGGEFARGADRAAVARLDGISTGRVLLHIYRDAPRHKARPADKRAEETPRQQQARARRRAQLRSDMMGAMLAKLDRDYARQCEEGAGAAPVDPSKHEGSPGESMEDDRGS